MLNSASENLSVDNNDTTHYGGNTPQEYVPRKIDFNEIMRQQELAFGQSKPKFSIGKPVEPQPYTSEDNWYTASEGYEPS